MEKKIKKISEILLQYETDKNLGTLYGDPQHRSKLVALNELWYPEIKGQNRPMLGHCYGAAYDEIFNKFMTKLSPTLLEIGVQRGASLLAWDDYFKDAHIYGVDIRDSRREKYKKQHKKRGINFILSDIRDPLLKRNLSHLKFDIIIDDGSHQLPDVVHVVNNYIELLSDQGIMIIEDCQEPEVWVKEIGVRLPKSFSLSFKDLRHINKLRDDYLIMIKRV
jgi:hypothetical protein